MEQDSIRETAMEGGGRHPAVDGQSAKQKEKEGTAQSRTESDRQQWKACVEGYIL